MKATVAALCFLATAVCVLAILPENICRGPHAMSTCAAGAAKKMWYFNNSTNKCVQYTGCGNGMNDFGSRDCCRDSCPYGDN
uniref:Putative salivary kunitz domain protein n=1 Tax=Ixodes ricinus TaxID=34613 RepID=A0A0K8R693_IXORI